MHPATGEASSTNHLIAAGVGHEGSEAAHHHTLWWVLVPLLTWLPIFLLFGLYIRWVGKITHLGVSGFLRILVPSQ